MAIDINIATTFLGNTDTPSTYVGQGSKVVSVKVDETGLEFTAASGGGGNNIYNADGTLTGNRTVSYNGFNLTFGVANSGGTLKTVSPGASASDTALAVRNSLDNANLFFVKGNGDFESISNYATGYQLSYKDTGGSLPILLLDAPNGGNAYQIFRNAGNNIKQMFTFVGEYWERVNIERHFNNFGQSTFYRDNVGNNWFGFDPTNLSTPEANVCVKIVSQTGQTALKTDGKIKSVNLPTYADNASALVGGLVVNDEYKTATGERRIVV